ncbi:MAG TPA: hypothetical protein VKV18_01550 [Chthonomonas sp.]|uniref:hypothetical protein n=1 Tax=Chthonomonas sp. TaxID=2282153 RepID=UPI002B4B8C28|nr:hypothetical protein [Chthonomonas sp.]HLI47362.1 hypothetical protein [Chthonomonas sp.]
MRATPLQRPDGFAVKLTRIFITCLGWIIGLSHANAAPITRTPSPPQHAYLLSQNPILSDCLLDGDLAVILAKDSATSHVAMELWHLNNVPVTTENIPLSEWISLPLPSIVAHGGCLIVGNGSLLGPLNNHFSVWIKNVQTGNWEEHPLPKPPSGTYDVYDCDASLVVGTVSQELTHFSAAFWEKDSSNNYKGPFLINPKGYANSCATGVVGSSRIVGYAQLLADNKQHAMLWQLASDNTTFWHCDLSLAIPVYLDITDSYAQAIDGNTVVGYGVDAQGNNHPLLWRVPSDISSLSTPSTSCDELPLPPGWYGEAFQIAGNYVVGVGYSDPQNQSATQHALLWHLDVDSGQWQFTDLQQIQPTPPNSSDSFTSSVAQGVNDNGEVSGLVYTAPSAGSPAKAYPVIWTATRLAFSDSSPSQNLPLMPLPNPLPWHFPLKPLPKPSSPWQSAIQLFRSLKPKLGRIVLGLVEIGIALGFFGAALECLEKAKRK